MSVSPAVQQAMEEAARGNAARAKELLRLALRRSPGDTGVLRAMAKVHWDAGEAEPALAFLKTAVGTSPADGALRVELATALAGAGRPEEAVRAYEECLKRQPGFLAAVDGLGRLLVSRGEFERAWGVYEAAARALPGRVEPYWLWVQVADHAGETGAAVRAARLGLEALPRHRDLTELLCYEMNFDERTDPDEHAALHRRLGEIVAANGRKEEPFANTREPERPLRVAFVSGDFCFHACAFFLAGLMTRLDRSRVQVLCYANNEPDDTSRNFAAAFAYRQVLGMDDEALAKQARLDGVDIAVDCGGWTQRSRLAGLTPRIAPVQMTYLGYPNTTGVPGIDYRIVDGVTDPPGTERWCTERLLRLEGCFICYSMAGQTPAPGVSPALEAAERTGAAGGPITFGSFSRPAKLQAGTLRAWGEILRRTPGSRLLMKATGRVGGVESFMRRFAAEGGEAARVVWTPFEPDPAQHLAVYRHVDVALDPFPYNGTTTTCEALVMGVPVVTLAGREHRARVGASLLTAAGCAEWIAGTPEEYVEKAAGLAADPAGLARTHRGLRDRVLRSRLCDAGAYAAGFEAALRGAWRAWCGASP